MGDGVRPARLRVPARCGVRAVACHRGTAHPVARRALAAVPLTSDRGDRDAHASLSLVRILAFSSADCRQCYEMQIPALQRVLDARGSKVSVAEVDAPNSPDLAQRYRVLTLPSTVIMDAAGHAHAVNYGFANTQHLLDQVDEILAQVSVS